MATEPPSGRSAAQVRTREEPCGRSRLRPAGSTNSQLQALHEPLGDLNDFCAGSDFQNALVCKGLSQATVSQAFFLWSPGSPGMDECNGSELALGSRWAPTLAPVQWHARCDHALILVRRRFARRPRVDSRRRFTWPRDARRVAQQRCWSYMGVQHRKCTLASSRRACSCRLEELLALRLLSCSVVTSNHFNIHS